MWNASLSIPEFIFRATFIYLALFIMFKFWGKKHISEVAAFDFLLMLIISEAVQNSLIGNDHSVWGGLVVVGTLMIIASLMNIISYYSRRAERLLEGTPKVIIRDGKIMDEVLLKERISLPELLETIREQGVLHLKDIRLAMLEANGKISVIKNQAA